MAANYSHQIGTILGPVRFLKKSLNKRAQRALERSPVTEDF